MGAAQQMLMSYGAAAGPAGVTWDPLHTSHVVLSNGNLTMTANATSGSNGTTQSTTTKIIGTSGKVYYELLVTTVGSGDGSPIGGMFTTAGAHQYNYYPTGNQVSGNGSFQGGQDPSNGDVIIIAVDFTAAKFWFGRNGVWFGGGNPGTGASPYFTGVPSGTYVAYAQASGSFGRVVTAHFAAASFAYTIPTGFSPW